MSYFVLLCNQWDKGFPTYFCFESSIIILSYFTPFVTECVLLLYCPKSSCLIFLSLQSVWLCLSYFCTVLNPPVLIQSFFTVTVTKFALLFYCLKSFCVISSLFAITVNQFVILLNCLKSSLIFLIYNHYDWVCLTILVS